MGMKRNLAGSIAVMALLAGCGGGGADEAIPEADVTITPGVRNDAPSPAETPTATPTPTPTPTPARQAAAESGQASESRTQQGSLTTDTGEYADAFVRAWGIGDRQDASRYASPTALDALFTYDGRGGSTWKRDSAISQGPSTEVRYKDGNGQSLYVVVDNATVGRGAGQAVVGANVEYDGAPAEPEPETDTYVGEDPSVTGLPTTSADYADSLVRAWGVGDRAAAQPYASDLVVSTLFDGYGTGGADWKQTSASPSVVSYRNSNGDTLDLHLDTKVVSAGRGNAVTYAEFG